MPAADRQPADVAESFAGDGGAAAGRDALVAAGHGGAAAGDGAPAGRGWSPQVPTGAPPRPFRARSVVASILLPLEPPALPVRDLVRCGELFGITEGTTRVTLSRMVSAGELEQGAEGYRLTGRMLARQQRQRRARHPQLQPWDGRWLLGVVVAERRRSVERAALRQTMAAARLAELRTGVWTRPDNLGAPSPALAAAAGQCLWMRGELADLAGQITAPAGSDESLAARLWDLPGWAAEARRLVHELSATLPALVAGDTSALAPCFAVAASAVRHITADPLLPAALLPPGWPGDRIRAAYDEYEVAYGRLLVAWLRSEGTS